MTKNSEDYKSTKEKYEPTQTIVIFDLDGCIANSDDFVITRLQAWEKKRDLAIAKGESYKEPKPSKQIESDFAEDYFYEEQENIPPYFGIFNLFVTLARMSNVAIVTSRKEILRAKTIRWLEQNVIKYYGERTWREVKLRLIFNEQALPTLQFKRKVFEQLSETFKISLVIEDHPEVIDYLKKKHIEVLVPGTGYKNLNGKDLNCSEISKVKRGSKLNDKLSQKRKDSKVPLLV